MIKQLLLLGVVASAYGRVPDHGTVSSIRDERCPESKVHHLIPHETDHDKFYLCQLGWRNAQPITCAPGTAFDYKLQVCDWLQYPRAQSINSVDGDQSNDEDKFLANGCPKDFLIHWLLPHETDCSKFYSCVKGNKWVLDCHPGLHFNADLQVCDWPMSAGCKSRSKGDEVAIESASSDFKRQDWLENGCPANSKYLWLLPHENDCSSFYLCLNGEKLKRECSFGLHFNPTTQICDWPSDAGCKAASDKSSVGTKVIVNSDVQRGEWLENGCPANSRVQWMLPHESDCSTFYLCLNGEKSKLKCPFGLHFNPAGQVCDWPSNAGCKAASDKSSVSNKVIVTSDVQRGEWLENGCPANSRVQWMLPHESDCSTFYLCLNGEKSKLKCPFGLHFNPASQICDWASSAGCEAESKSVASKVIADEEWLPNGCPADPLVHWLLPHETDCTKFYSCVGGHKWVLECQPGLHFNAELQVCDWIFNAGCKA